MEYTKKDKKEAINFYKNKKSKLNAKQAFLTLLNTVDKKNPDDCSRIGNSYDFGIGTKKNFKKAFEWYLKAGKLGEVTAMYNLYLMFREGEGVPRNLKKAIFWLKKAALVGDAESLSDMGYAHFHGRGLKQNKAKGIEYYKKAARLKLPRAHFNLALVYLDGDSVKPNYKLGLKYLNKALDLGHKRSAMTLARVYNGSFEPDIKENLALSKKYLKLARSYGIK